MVLHRLSVALRVESSIVGLSVSSGELGGMRRRFESRPIR
jgi:hypothetical protein